MKIALITGITGQDGSYLAEFLIEKGYEVHGIVRQSSQFNRTRIEHLYLEKKIKDLHLKNKLTLHYGDMTDSSSLIRIIQKVKPDEIYNLAAQSHVKVSFELPEYTANVDAIGTLKLLEAINNPVIIHFSGSDDCKPWHYSNNHKFKNEYEKYLAKTVFKDVKPIGFPEEKKLTLRDKFYLFRQELFQKK